MRTLFDQYVHPENRLTHALVASLAEDTALLRSFLRRLDVAPPRGEALHLVEQRLPGEADDRPETSESDTRRVPDAWIYTASGWALLIESKIAAPIDAAQLRGHLAIAERRGFTDVRLLVLSPSAPPRALPDRCQHRRWRDLYAWACAEAPRSPWATHLIRYMPVAEQRMVTDQYLQEGTLTTFTGIPFGVEVPYTYLEAKRLLRLLMAEVQADPALDALGVDRARGGRPSITGSAQTSVWDYLPFAFSDADEGFTRYPHLTLSIQRDRALAQLILPDKLDGAMRRQLLSGGYEVFKAAHWPLHRAGAGVVESRHWRSADVRGAASPLRDATAFDAGCSPGVRSADGVLGLRPDQAAGRVVAERLRCVRRQTVEPADRHRRDLSIRR
jgi:hypothetical protein